ncbi:hypothetical protein HYU20_01175 [Candidatus Woesearchaeota archaeon]|nr:hypothetical protein [Candidatus Woesearchaeota archaeon]
MERSLFNNGGSDNGGNSAVDWLKQRFEAALKGIREEFDDHRESINDNTNEIEANYEMLCKLDAKVDRVEGQLEHLQLSLSQFLGSQSQPLSQQPIELDEREKDVFLVLYTAADDKPLTYRDIATAMKESEFLVRGYITNMIEKGVPITKRYVNDVAYVSFDRHFKDRQAKENIVKLSQRTVGEFVD